MACSIPLDLLQCAICLGQQSVPRTLPCLHSYCQNCLQTHIETSLETQQTQNQELEFLYSLQTISLDSIPNHTNGGSTRRLSRNQGSSDLIVHNSEDEITRVGYTPSLYQESTNNNELTNDTTSDQIEILDLIAETEPPELSAADEGFLCPTCREYTTIPQLGAQGFPKDFRILQLIELSQKEKPIKQKRSTVCGVCSEESTEELEFCVDCRKFFCPSCSSQHNEKSIFASHIMISTAAAVSSQQTTAKRCKLHKKEHMKFYCEDCNVSACLICTLGSHGDHYVTNIKSTLNNKHSDLKGCLDHLRNQVWILQDIMFNLTCMEGKIRGKYDEMKLQIRKNSRRLANKVFAEEMRLFNDLEETYSVQSEEVNRRKQQCQGHLSQFQMLQTRLDSILQVQDVEQVMVNYNQIIQEIQKVDIHPEYKNQLLDLGNQPAFIPNRNTKINLGSIQFRDHDDHSPSNSPSKDTVICSPPRVGVSNHNNSDKSVSEQINEAYSVLHNMVPTSLAKVDRISRSSSGATNSPDSGCCSEFPEGNVLYNPKNYLAPLGTSELPSIKLLFTVGGPQSNSQGQVSLPYSAVFDNQGHLVVAENGRSRLHFFGIYGHSTKIIPLGACIPRSITYTKDGDFAFTDENSKSVKILTNKGRLLCTLSQVVDSFPFGIVALQDGRCAVSDIIFESISIISQTGKIEHQFGADGNSGEILDNPSYIATDNFGNILISDSGHHEIKVFDNLGRFLYKFGGYGTEGGYMRYPKGIVCDRNGVVYVADSGNNRVVAFSDIGIYLGTVADRDQGIRRPVGLAYSLVGKLAVTMPDLDQVAVFELSTSVAEAGAGNELDLPSCH